MRCFIGNPFEDQHIDESGDELDGIDGGIQIQRDLEVQAMIHQDTITDEDEVEEEEELSEESLYVPDEDDVPSDLDVSWESFDEDFHGYNTRSGVPEFSDYEDDEDDDMDYVTYPIDTDHEDVSNDENQSWVTTDSEDFLSDLSTEEQTQPPVTKNANADNLNANNTGDTTEENVANDS